MHDEVDQCAVSAGSSVFGATKSRAELPIFRPLHPCPTSNTEFSPPTQPHKTILIQLHRSTPHVAHRLKFLQGTSILLCSKLSSIISQRSVRWPSWLWRQVKVLLTSFPGHESGVGSSPTLINIRLFNTSSLREYLFAIFGAGLGPTVEPGV